MCTHQQALRQNPASQTPFIVGLNMLVPVIISGGSGSRLWPVSREMYPKPFIKLADGESLLQKTYQRACQLHDVSSIITVTNENLFFLTQDTYKESIKSTEHPPSHHYLLEPIGRNTAPAIAISAAYIAKKFGSDTTMLVLSADHLINKTDAFDTAVAQATQLASQGRLVTFGIQPTHPETGYGYIESKGTDVVAFVEKPDLNTAIEYVSSGRFVWNAGIFCFQAGVLLQELSTHAPDLYAAVMNCLDNTEEFDFEAHFPKACFEVLEDISIDYAIMERSKNVSVVTCDIGWSDVGSWNAIGDLSMPDANGNQIEANVLLEKTNNCFIKSEADRLVCTVGVEDLIIVDTPDALLVANRAHAQDVKAIVTQLKKINHEAYKLHRTVARPWGTYTVLEEGDGFKMKRIVVKPGGSLSLQMHHHRSEHWIVVSGIAKVVNGEQEILIHPNQSTYIPAGQTHRLTNPGVLDCVMIEVQVGGYLGEDDIVRFTDIYGRC